MFCWRSLSLVADDEGAGGCLDDDVGDGFELRGGKSVYYGRCLIAFFDDVVFGVRIEERSEDVPPCGISSGDQMEVV